MVFLGFQLVFRLQPDASLSDSVRSVAESLSFRIFTCFYKFLPKSHAPLLHAFVSASASSQVGTDQFNTYVTANHELCSHDPLSSDLMLQLSCSFCLDGQKIFSSRQQWTAVSTPRLEA
ncbi:unnamed protein product [Protopolystoma xenopodis]|uniref:Uncharacterized protein n=1 Tax=Protopolystoma xenopodis TaxID=117903 RepID=A0A3S5ARC9_9PLAT|nr:unnamed protein product [Protopolystoma xenopodis]